MKVIRLKMQRFPRAEIRCKKECMFDFLSAVVFTLGRLALVRTRAAPSNRQHDQFFAQFHMSHGRMTYEAM
jgi:hypothetical protein